MHLNALDAPGRFFRGNLHSHSTPLGWRLEPGRAQPPLPRTPWQTSHSGAIVYVVPLALPLGIRSSTFRRGLPPSLNVLPGGSWGLPAGSEGLTKELLGLDHGHVKD
jgi:hypothetical protein